MHLREKLRDFGHAGIRKHPTRDLLLVGVDCALWTWPVVQAVVGPDWLGTEASIAGLRKLN